IIFHLLERRRRPRTIVLMIQREVADRLVAAPDTAEYGALTVDVQTVADVERLLHVGQGAFRPLPNADSTAGRTPPHQPPHLTEDEERDVRSLTHMAFGWRRKQLQKTLHAAPKYALDAAAVERIAQNTEMALHRRAESLSIDEFVALARALRNLGKPE